MQPVYRGRFAPSPTGPLHAGSLVAALASWLDARAHGGTWLVRMEDVDSPRCVPGAAALILEQLAACGLVSDEPVWVQSARSPAYASALAQLQAAGLAFPCACTRKNIELALQAQGQSKPRHGELRYPGICRPGIDSTTGREGRAWRLHTGLAAQDLEKMGQKQASTHDDVELTATKSFDGTCHWHDRRLGTQQQQVEHTVGDFVLKRADGLWAYQLAVVVDDAAQGITHVVRGADLADNTPRQLLLQRTLGLPHPAYLHTPLVLGANGEKLSKQNGAAALALDDPLAELNAAATALGLSNAPDLPAAGANTHHRPQRGAVAKALQGWVAEWAARWTGRASPGS